MRPGRPHAFYTMVYPGYNAAMILHFLLCCLSAPDEKMKSTKGEMEEKPKTRINKNMYMCSSSDEMLTEDELWNDDILEPTTSIPVESQSLPASII